MIVLAAALCVAAPFALAAALEWLLDLVVGAPRK